MFISNFQNLPTRRQLQKYILTKLNCNIVQFLFNLSLNFTKSSETLSLTLLDQGLQKQVKIGPTISSKSLCDDYWSNQNSENKG